jgi:chromosome segregation ATPase
MQLKKKEFENLLKNLKLKSNEYIFKINEQNQKIKEYRDYLNKIYNNIISIRENISNNNIHDGNMDKILEQIEKQFDKCSLIFTELEDMLPQNNSNFQNEFENILSEIQLNIENFDKNEYQDEISINNIYTNINNKINEIKKVFDNFNKIKNNFENLNNNVARELKV